MSVALAAGYAYFCQDERPVGHGSIIVAPVPHQASSPVVTPRHVDLGGTQRKTVSDATGRSDADVALLTDRFNAAPADPALVSREGRLRSQIERLAVDGTRFEELAVECRAAMCQLSGRIVKAGSAADRTSAFALVHRPELFSIGAAEGLDPGPIAIAAETTAETRFFAFLVAA